VAFRVALGLVVLLLFAPPASAQFTTERDINGLWVLHATRVPVGQSGESGWVQGLLRFFQDGAIATDDNAAHDQNGTPVVLHPGSLTTTASGEVTGTLNGVAVQGRFLDRNVLAGVATADAGTADETQSFFVMIRDLTAAFSQVDATGTWRLSTMLVPGSEGTPEWVLGDIVVGAGGAITGGALTSSDGLAMTDLGGTLVVAADGTFEGEVTVGTTGGDAIAFSGTFTTGRQLMVGAASRFVSEEARHGMLFLQRRQAEGFAQQDANGTWHLFSVQATLGPVGTWLRGTLSADPFGMLTSGTLTDGLGNSYDALEGGFISVLPDGTVVAEVLFGSAPDLIVVQGSMLPNKVQIVGVDHFLGRLTPYFGLTTLLKVGPAEPTPVIVQFGQPTYTVTEGTANAVITVTRSGTSTGAFTVPYTATAGTAVAGEDFTPVSGTLNFTSGALSRTFNVPILNNQTVDGTRSVVLTLGQPTGAVLGPLATAALSILDNDQGGTVKLSTATYTVAETARSIVVTVQRAGASLSGNVSVPYTTANGTATAGADYTATSGVLTFGPGQTSRTVSIPITNDGLAESNETFTFSLGEPSGGATLGVPAVATITIKSEDAGGTITFKPAVYTVSEGAGTLTVTVARTGGTAEGVEVDYTLVSGTATVQGNGTVAFAAGKTTATFTLAIDQDQQAEGNETFTIVLSNPRGGATLGSASVATVTILDDESSIQFSAGEYGGREGATTSVTLVRSGALGTPATVTFAATPGTAAAGVEFTPVTTVVSFAAGQASKTVPVPILNNTLVRGDRTVLLGLSAPTGGAQLGARRTAVLTVRDDDQGGVIKLGAAAYTVRESAGAVLVRVLRTGTKLAGNVSVDFATVDGTARSNQESGNDYEARSGRLTFGPNETSKTISIPIVPDALVEPSETFSVVLGNPLGGAVLGTPATTTVTIRDDEAASEIKLGATSYTFAEAAGAVSIPVKRSGQLGQAVTVSYAITSPPGRGAATPGEDFTGSLQGTLSFAPSQTTAAIPLTIVQDELSEGSETFTITLLEAGGAARVVAPSTATVTIVDDEPVVQFSLRFVGNMPEVVRTGPTNRQITVDYRSVNGTAIEGEDYRLPPGTLTFGVGQSSRLIPLVIAGDVFAEGPETFTIVLSNPQPQGAAALGPFATQTFTIADNDVGGIVQFGAATQTAAPGTTKTIPIVRAGGGGTILTVHWQVLQGASSETVGPTSGSVTFGANETTKSFSVQIGGVDSEGPVAVVFGLSVPEGAATLGPTSTSTLTIVGSPPSDPEQPQGPPPAAVGDARLPSSY
jgi:hypothetical protein